MASPLAGRSVGTAIAQGLGSWVLRVYTGFRV